MVDEAKVDESKQMDFAKVEKRVRSTGGGSTGTVSDPNEKFYGGDNQYRTSGQAMEFKQLNVHAWEPYEKGQDVHMQVAPSQAELLYKNYKVIKEKLKTKTKDTIMEKYGNAAAEEEIPKELLLGQSEKQVEYDRAGRMIKGQCLETPFSLQQHLSFPLQFGWLGLMWSSFNPHGTTLFLEEDPKWVQTILRDAASLHAQHVLYHTQLSQADELIRSYRSEQDCAHLQLKGNSGCRLALSDLPSEVYDKEWDLIMIDAPRGYFHWRRGKMGAIYSISLLWLGLERVFGVTHVFLHDVDRKVEKMFAEEFLCRKHLVHAVGRLWHFQIPSGINLTHSSNAITFCSNN
ncbi:hypothetical protein IFM89_006505 [Coptis chinensis]|uniref:Pre-mRNA-splicing factor SLU7 domain-containing protein n=1 Tax=Coptis chinensis TaxID=261450 RepID=A0A835IPH4_9MAGN|nr:hypothetical protein IFM89_006505 [Coptis chinensis]